MGVGDRLGDLEEEDEAGLDVEPPGVGEAIDPLAVDQLEDEVGLARLGDAGVVEPRANRGITPTVA